MDRKTYQQQFLDVVAHRRNSTPVEADFLCLFNDFLKQYGHPPISKKALEAIEANEHFVPTIHQYYLIFHGVDVNIDGVSRKYTMKSFSNAKEKANILKMNRELLVVKGKEGPPPGVVADIWIRNDEGRAIRMGAQEDMSHEVWTLIKKAFELHLYEKEQEIRRYMRASEKPAPTPQGGQ